MILMIGMMMTGMMTGLDDEDSMMILMIGMITDWDDD